MFLRPRASRSTARKPATRRVSSSSPAGRHSVAIAAERYQPFSADVDVEGLGKTQTFKPQLVPGWGVVTVTSEPAGAQLLVNGEPRGVTPLKAEIMAGAHPVELRLEGFKPWTTDIQVKANEPLALGPVKLGLPDGRLAVRSDPPGASVSVAGVYRGQTPIELELRPDLDHSIVLTRPGYEAVTRQVSLSAGEQRTLSLPLSGVFGEVAVRAQPADAQLYIDGKPSGAANQTLRLVATTHEIEIRKTGFVDFKTSVTPRPGVQQRVETTLLTPEQSRIAATPAVARTKFDQQLRLMPIGQLHDGQSAPRAGSSRQRVAARRRVQARLLSQRDGSEQRASSAASSPSIAPASSAITRSTSTTSRWSASPGWKRRCTATGCRSRMACRPRTRRRAKRWSP